jgi:hypothetical protein
LKPIASNNKSNLAYCNKGAFGSIVTKNDSDYLPATGTATRASNSDGIKSSLQSSNVTSNTYFRVAYSSSSSTGEGDTVLKHDGSFQHYFQHGTASTIGQSGLSLGNSTKSGVAGNTRGALRMFDTNDKLGILYAGNGTLTGNRNYYLPDQTGTLIISGSKSVTSGSSCSITLKPYHGYIIFASNAGMLYQAMVGPTESGGHYVTYKNAYNGSSSNDCSISGTTFTVTFPGTTSGMTIYWTEL